MDQNQNKMFTFILLGVIIVIVVVGITLLVKKEKDNNPTCDDSKCKSYIENNYEKGFPEKLQYKSDNSTLDLANLYQNFTNLKNEEGVLTDKKTIFQNGINVYFDKTLVNITVDEPTNTSLEQVLSIQNPPKDNDINKIQYYIDLISDYLTHNPTADERWKKILNYLGWLITGKGTQPTKPKINDLPDMNDIYNWCKYLISKIGGLSGLLHRFQKRIKYDLIQDLVNNVPGYRIPNTAGQSKQPTNKCTSCPAKLWQSCPDKSIPVGQQGFKKDGACNKWYQHASCELLCAKYDTDYSVKSFEKSKCNKITDFIKDDKLHEKISEILTKILGLLGLIPGTQHLLQVIQQIIKNGLKIVGDLSWIKNDILDICYNFMCDNCKKTYCTPNITDTELINRDCGITKDGKPTNPLCFTNYAGQCSEKPPNNMMVLNNTADGNNADVNEILKLSDMIGA